MLRTNTSKGLLPVLVASGLLSATCGGGGGGGGPVTAPSPPPQTQPPTVWVGGGSNYGDDGRIGWNGQASYNEGGSSAVTLVLTQAGAQVTGTIGAFGNAGPIAGTVSGNTLIFSFSEGNHGLGCGNAISGVANVGGNGMTATFSGHGCSGEPVTNGTFTVNGPSPPWSTMRYSATGTWTFILFVQGVGGSALTLNIAQDGDITGGNLTGSASASATNNALKLGSGSLTGTNSNTFPGLPSDDNMTINVTLGGACPVSLLFKPARMMPDGQSFGANVTGMTCNTTIPLTYVQLQKQ